MPREWWPVLIDRDELDHVRETLLDLLEFIPGDLRSDVTVSILYIDGVLGYDSDFLSRRRA